ncbi:MAG: response regulator [Marinibacterium sp.]
MAIRIVIADDHPLFREGVVAALEAAEGLNVIAEAENADAAIAASQAYRPDLVLLDISMPGDGLRALREIVAAGTAGRVAMLTVSEEEDDLLQSIRAGAQGYILKGIAGRDLVRAIREIAAGRGFVPQSLTERVQDGISADRQREQKLAMLTPREENVLNLLSQGMNNREIAETLSLQEKTIKHYMTAILQKLGVRNRTEAALMAQNRLRD